MRSYPLYIDGADCEGRRWIYSVRASAFLDDQAEAFALKRALELGGDPPEGEESRIVGRCAQGGEEDNARALEAAARAAREYGRFPVAVRRQMIRDLHAALDERGPELVEILVAEGHPRRLAEWEVSGIVAGCCPSAEEWNSTQLEREFVADGRRVLLRRKPDGVVCVNPPQNAAGSNAALGFAALVGGNAVVVKAPRTSPVSVMFFFREIVAPILAEHGAPPGTLNVICGGSKQVLRQWLASPHVDDVMFFGDSASGLKFGAECVARGKKPILELSGNDGLVVWRDADLDGAAEAACESFYGSGQICMVPKYAVVHPAVADEFAERVCAKIETIVPGYPEDPSVLLSPVLKTDKFFDFLAEAREAGAPVLTGGRRVDVHGEPAATGLFCEPTLLLVNGLEHARDLQCVREETFFPLLPVIVPEDGDDDAELLERVLAFVDENEYGLRNSVWADDPAVIDAFVDGLRGGGLLKVNDSHIGFVPYLATHGGTGRTGGPFGELNYPALRTTHLQGISIAERTAVREEEATLVSA